MIIIIPIYTIYSYLCMACYICVFGINDDRNNDNIDDGNNDDIFITSTNVSDSCTLIWDLYYMTGHLHYVYNILNNIYLRLHTWK